MAETTAIQEKSNTNQTGSARLMSNSRRYVGSKESLAYVVYDISQSYNINKYQDIFITDVVKIGLSFQTVVTFVIGIWDVINDVFLAAIVDKTRTRFGKFRPWLFICSGPGYLLSLVYWLLPIIFAATDPYHAGKLAFYMAFQLISNLNGSLATISRTGMLSTITPNVIERTRLITQATTVCL